MGSRNFKERHDALEELLALIETLPERQRRQGGVVKKLLLMLTGSLALAGLFVGIGFWRSGAQFVGAVRAAFLTPPPAPRVDVRSIVVQQVRAASELTTAVFGMQAVVPTSRDRTLGGYVIGKTTLLYIAYGEVRAGVDLGEVQPKDIEIVGNTITLTLPPPQILDSKVDVTRSNVYDYDRGFLGLGPDVAPELQELAQQETLKEIIETACEQGILQQANDRAKLVVTQLLNTVDHQQLTVVTQPPTAAACLLPNASSPSLSAEPANNFGSYPVQEP